MSLIDARDIAAVACAALLGDAGLGETLELTGGEALSNRAVAAQLSALLGHVVAYQDVSESAAREGMRAAGMPRWVVDVILEPICALLWRSAIAKSHVVKSNHACVL